MVPDSAAISLLSVCYLFMINYDKSASATNLMPSEILIINCGHKRMSIINTNSCDPNIAAKIISRQYFSFLFCCLILVSVCEL